MIAVVIASFGDDHWRELALTRAYPSVVGQLEEEYIVMSHARQGPIEAVRNVAVTDAPGDWVCFLDADDELDPGFVTAMLHAILDDRDDLRLLCPYVQQIRDGVEEPAKLPGGVQTMPPLNHCVVGTVLHRQLFEDAGGFNEEFWPWSDYELWLRCARRGARVVPVPDAIYRVHVNPLSDNHTIPKADRVKLGRRILREHRNAGGSYPIEGGGRETR